MARSCWASDIQERTQFHDCTVGVAGNVYYDRDYNNAEQKVSYFSPLTLLGLRVPTVAPTTGVSVTVLLEQTYYFTFRNPKFGGDPLLLLLSLLRLLMPLLLFSCCCYNG